MAARQDILFSTNSQRVLGFFLINPGQEFLEKEVCRAVKISKSGVNYAIRELSQARLLKRVKRGMVYFCSLDHRDPVIKQLKVAKVVLEISPLVKKLSEMASRIVLFGSASRGEDISESDVDLLVLTGSTREEVELLCSKSRLKRKIQLIIRSEAGYADLKQKDPHFTAQIEKGIVLWEKE